MEQQKQNTLNMINTIKNVDKFIYSILDVTDDMERLLNNNYSEGAKHIYDKMINILSNNGIYKINVKEGDTFDYTKHDAVIKKSTDFILENNMIVGIVSNGYSDSYGNIIRYPKVVVAKYNKNINNY